MTLAGIETVSSDWKTDVLFIVLLRQLNFGRRKRWHLVLIATVFSIIFFIVGTQARVCFCNLNHLTYVLFEASFHLNCDQLRNCPRSVDWEHNKTLWRHSLACEIRRWLDVSDGTWKFAFKVVKIALFFRQQNMIWW